MDNDLKKALRHQYKSVISAEEFKIKCWLKMPTLTPSHMNVMKEFDEAIAKIADYKARIDELERIDDETTPDLYH